MTIDLFVPCFIDQMYPNVGWSTVKVLEKAGCQVEYNPKQTCCGQPLFNSGDMGHATKLAEKFVKDFPNDRPIITPSASCAAYIKKHYAKLLANTSYKDEALRLQQNTFELCDFLVNKLQITDFNSTFNHTITYHDACSALREYGLKDEPRLLLSKVNGLRLVEMEKRDECCGFGGTFMVKYAGISSAMTAQKVENAMDTKAEYIVSTESSCLLNIQSYINKQKLNIKTLHISEILANNEERR